MNPPWLTKAFENI